MLIKCLFGLVALTSLAILFLTSPPPEFDEGERLRRALLLIGLAVAGLGLIMPWGRWLMLVSPGGNLAFASRVLGWAGACGVPFTVASGNWLVALVCILLPGSAFALWKQRAWAAWPWYGVAVAAFAGSIASLVGLFSGSNVVDAGSAYSAGSKAGRILGVLLWGGIAIALIREVTLWRRRLTSTSSTPGSSSAS
jgi:hypothetical protein